jgi:hypothetical protein
MGGLFHNHPLLDCSDLKGKSLFVVTFNELIGDAHKTIHKRYGNPGMAITDKFEQSLLNSQAR